MKLLLAIKEVMMELMEDVAVISGKILVIVRLEQKNEYNFLSLHLNKQQYIYKTFGIYIKAIVAT